ncbi:MAG TPA: hypothetical protein VLV16_07940 [Gemmatimonadales bacterium]|nr:hypothetical protein [Gemmatimonadales bacterium]
MALALAIVVIVVGGGLTALMFYVAFEEGRLSGSGVRVQQAFGVAEEGALEVLRAWDPRTYNVHDPYPFHSAMVPAGFPADWTAAPHGTGAYGGQVYKLNSELYLIDMTGRDDWGPPPGASAVRQRVAVLARVQPVAPGLVAALTVGKGSRRAGTVSIAGRDGLPPDWEPCGPPDSNRVGLDTVRGGLAAFSSGGFTYAELASLATRSVAGAAVLSNIGPTVVDGRCDETVATNWGGTQPNQVCGGYLPVVHIVGAATLAGVDGQGTLLVDGDLTVRGGLRWRGLVLVGGALRVTPGAAKDVAVWGAVFAADSATLEAGVAGSVAITYSKCAVVKALESVAPAVMFSSRGWLGLSEAP